MVVFALGMAAWEFGVKALDVQNFLLPPLSDILETLWGDRSGLMSAAWFTFKEALGGFVIGSGAGILLALVLARWRPLASAIMPYAIAANAIPIIAFAPITNNWFGLLSPASKIAIAAIICFFPVFVNTLRGLTSVRPASIELMRSLRGRRGRDLPPRAHPERAAVHLLGLEGRDRTRDDRRHRGRLLRRLC